MQRRTSLIMLSTPAGDAGQSYFTRLMELKDKSGKNTFFNVTRIGVACAHCEREGNAITCPHDVEDNDWMSGPKKARLGRFYEGAPERHEQENFGMIVQSSQQVFAERLIQRLMTAPRFKVQSPPDLLYLTVDPSGASHTASDMAMSLGFFRQGVFVVSTLRRRSRRGRRRTACQCCRRRRRRQGPQSCRTGASRCRPGARPPLAREGTRSAPARRQGARPWP